MVFATNDRRVSHNEHSETAEPAGHPGRQARGSVPNRMPRIRRRSEEDPTKVSGGAEELHAWRLLFTVRHRPAPQKRAILVHNQTWTIPTPPGQDEQETPECLQILRAQTRGRRPSPTRLRRARTVALHKHRRIRGTLPGNRPANLQLRRLTNRPHIVTTLLPISYSLTSHCTRWTGRWTSV